MILMDRRIFENQEYVSQCNIVHARNFNSLFLEYSNKLKGKQKASKKVLESSLIEIVTIRDLVQKHNRFLEQEILIND